MTPFEIIRERLELREVVEHYGIEIKRNNTCLCPFHDDHHPSAHVYPKAFHCFTCNLHYDVLGFVMALFGLSALDAAKKLNDDFHLGIEFGKQKNQPKQTYNESAEILEIRRKKRERFIRWEQEAYQTIHDYWWLVKEWHDTLKPPKMDYAPENYQLDERFVYALQHYSFAESFSLDWIQKFSDDEKVEYKWIVDKMQKFLDDQKQKIQKDNYDGYIEILGADSLNNIPVNW